MDNDQCDHGTVNLELKTASPRHSAWMRSRRCRGVAQAAANNDPARLTPTLEQSIESHRMAFAAERSRLGGTVESVVV